MANLLYIHGFMSSPLSYKAQAMKSAIEQQYSHFSYYCPQLNENPKAAIAKLSNIINSKPNEEWLLIGSSLGGYYATYLSEKYKIRAVLINPAIKPYELLINYLGEQKNYHTDDVVEVKASYMDELKFIEKHEITKNNYLLLVQTGDEVLNYQQAVDKFKDCQHVIEQGGDHSFINFERKIPQIMAFLNER